MSPPKSIVTNCVFSCNFCFTFVWVCPEQASVLRGDMLYSTLLGRGGVDTCRCIIGLPTWHGQVDSGRGLLIAMAHKAMCKVKSTVPRRVAGPAPKSLLISRPTHSASEFWCATCIKHSRTYCARVCVIWCAVYTCGPHSWCGDRSISRHQMFMSCSTTAPARHHHICVCVRAMLVGFTAKF